MNNHIISFIIIIITGTIIYLSFNQTHIQLRDLYLSIGMLSLFINLIFNSGDDDE